MNKTAIVGLIVVAIVIIFTITGVVFWIKGPSPATTPAPSSSFTLPRTTIGGSGIIAQTPDSGGQTLEFTYGYVQVRPGQVTGTTVATPTGPITIIPTQTRPVAITPTQTEPIIAIPTSEVVASEDIQISSGLIHLPTINLIRSLFSIQQIIDTQNKTSTTILDEIRGPVTVQNSSHTFGVTIDEFGNYSFFGTVSTSSASTVTGGNTYVIPSGTTNANNILAAAASETTFPAFFQQLEQAFFSLVNQLFSNSSSASGSASSGFSGSGIASGGLLSSDPFGGPIIQGPFPCDNIPGAFWADVGPPVAKPVICQPGFCRTYDAQPPWQPQQYLLGNLAPGSTQIECHFGATVYMGYPIGNTPSVGASTQVSDGSMSKEPTTDSGDTATKEEDDKDSDGLQQHDEKGVTCKNPDSCALDGETSDKANGMGTELNCTNGTTTRTDENCVITSAGSLTDAPHGRQCHADGTCFDINCRGSCQTNANACNANPYSSSCNLNQLISDINRYGVAANNNGLYAEFETNNSTLAGILRTNPNVKTPILYYGKASATHFSVLNCSGSTAPSVPGRSCGR